MCTRARDGREGVFGLASGDKKPLLKFSIVLHAKEPMESLSLLQGTLALETEGDLDSIVFTFPFIPSTYWDQLPTVGCHKVPEITLSAAEHVLSALYTLLNTDIKITRSAPWQLPRQGTTWVTHSGHIPSNPTRRRATHSCSCASKWPTLQQTDSHIVHVCIAESYRGGWTHQLVATPANPQPLCQQPHRSHSPPPQHISQYRKGRSR